MRPSKISKHLFDENKEKIETEAIHNGYEKDFGCIFKRKITIDKSTNNLLGCDEILKEKDGKPINYTLRFHLYPGISAVRTIGGKSVRYNVPLNWGAGNLNDSEIALYQRLNELSMENY